MDRRFEVALIACALSGDFTPTLSTICGVEGAAPAGGGVAPSAPVAVATPAAPAKAPDATAANAPQGTPDGSPPAAAEPARDPVALALAKLAAGEAKLKAERAKLTELSTTLTQREKALTESAAQANAGLEALRARAKSGAHDEVLKELGLDYVTLTKARIEKQKGQQSTQGAQPAQPVDVAAEVQRIVAETLAKRDEEAKKRADEEKAASEAKAVEAWNGAVATFEGLVKKGGVEKYEELTIELKKRPALVHDALRELAQRSPELTFEAAADKLEEFFRREVAEAAERVKRRTPATESKQNEADLPRAQPGQATEGGPRTLTNALAAERSSTDDSSLPAKPLSRTAQIRAQREEEARELRRIEALAKR